MGCLGIDFCFLLGFLFIFPFSTPNSSFEEKVPLWIHTSIHCTVSSFYTVQCLHPGLMIMAPSRYLSVPPVAPVRPLVSLMCNSHLVGPSPQPMSCLTEPSLHSVPTGGVTPLKTLTCVLTWPVPEPWQLTLPPWVISCLYIFTWSPCLKFLNFDHYKIFQNKFFIFLIFWCVCNPLSFIFFHQIFLVFSFTFNLSLRNF